VEISGKPLIRIGWALLGLGGKKEQQNQDKKESAVGKSFIPERNSTELIQKRSKSDIGFIGKDPG
jgi:hypothetical protein